MKFDLEDLLNTGFVYGLLVAIACLVWWVNSPSADGDIEDLH